MTKRDYLRDVFRIWLTICQISFDDADVYSSGGHWYGQTRDIASNGYDTTITGEYIITFNKKWVRLQEKDKLTLFVSIPLSREQARARY